MMLNPEKILASGDILEKIDAICKRHFSAENDCDECYVFVLDGLNADNFRRLRAFKGKSKLSTYLYALVNSLVIDFRRKRYGRRRIPASVRKLGGWAEAAYRMICWQKYSLDDAFDFLQVDGLYTGSYQQFRQDAAPIQEAPCRRDPSFKSVDNSPASPLRDVEDPGSNPLEKLLDKIDRQRRTEAVERIRETTKGFSETDQLLVRLVFGSDHPVRTAAKIINLSTSAARRRLKGILIKYKENLLAAGIREL